MAVDVITEIVIDRPCPVVAEYAGDPSNATEWYANIDSVQWQPAPPVQVGSRVDFVARFLGRRLAAPVMAAAMRRANEKDLARLKQLLEREPQG